MENRFIAVAGAALIGAAGFSGCSEVQTVSQDSARVTVDGETYTTSAPRCTQLQSFRTINIHNDVGSVEAVVLLTGDRVIPKWVKIRDFEGFSGSFWQGGVGDAAANIGRNALTITGSAYGIHSSNPNKATTTDFKITAKC